MPRPDVSVIITAHNQARFLAEALDSLQTQSVPALEVIVVDDGSTDNPREVVQAFENVTFIRQGNRGLGAARDAGCAESSGKYIAFCDADDIQQPFRLAAQKTLLDRNPEAALVFSELRPFENGEIKDEELLKSRKLGPLTQSFEIEIEEAFGSWWTCGELGVPVPEEYFGRRVYQGRVAALIALAHLAWGGASMIRRTAFDAVGGHDHSLRRYADWHLVSRISKAYEIIFCDVPVVLYRVHDAQLTKLSALGSRCYKDVIEEVWRSDPSQYARHSGVIDRVLGLAYWQLGAQAAAGGDWVEAEENFVHSISANPQQRRVYLDLAKAAFRRRMNRD